MSYTPSSFGFGLPRRPANSDVRPDYQLHHYNYAGIDFTIELTRVDTTTWQASILMTAQPSSRTERVNIHRTELVKSDYEVGGTVIAAGFKLNSM